MDWQPIETANKHGRDEHGQLGIAGAEPYGSRWSFYHCWWNDAEDCWQDIKSDWVVRPTLWQPLPSPPERKET